LEQLKQEFLAIQAMENRQSAGYALEKLLNRLFEIFGLSPKEPFRVIGEQIDGSFELDNVLFLLEAKWTKEQIGSAELYVFRAKVDGKSSHTRGLFISISGFSGPGLTAIRQNKTPNFIMMDGVHLFRVLDGHISLVDLLRQIRRHFDQTGNPYLPASDLDG
jgi:hypothetical protein